MTKAVSGTDWGLISDNDNYSFDNTIRYPSGEKYPVKGHATRDGLRNWESSGKTIYKIGRETGISTGKIQYRNGQVSDGCLNHSLGVGFGNDVGAGDSGGVAFIINNGNAFVAALIQYSTGYPTGAGCSLASKYDKSGGLPAWYLTNQGLIFG